MMLLMVLIFPIILIAFGSAEPSDSAQAALEDTSGAGDAKPVSYISPSATGAFLGECFDDSLMFEEDWIISEGTSPVDNKKERWQLLPVPGGDWREDLGLTLAAGCRHLSISRPLSRPLSLDRRPLIVQFQLRLPRVKQCAGVQLRLLTDSRHRLDRISRSTAHTLRFTAETCADRVTLGLSLWPAAGGTERRAPTLSVPVSGAGDQRPHRYRLLLTADGTATLLIDDQLLKNISIQSLLESESHRADEAEDGLTGEEPEAGVLGASSNLQPAEALNVELWSAGDGLFLDNLLITSSPEQADRFAPPPRPSVQPAHPGLWDDLDWYLDYSAERPWVYFMLVLAIGVPACLLLSCCLPESLDLEAQRRKAEALKKKTDDEPDSQQTQNGRPQAGGLFGSKLGGGRGRPLQNGQPRRRTLRRD